MRSVILLLMLVLVSAFFGCGKQMTDADHVQRAKDFLDKNDLQATGIELKNALQKNPNNAEARFLLGQVNIEVGNGAAAEKELKRALELGVAPEAIGSWVARSYLLQREYEKVIREFPADNVSNPAQKTVLLALNGEALIGLGKTVDACPKFTEAESLSPNFVPAYLGLAKCAVGSKKLDEAKQYLDKAIAIDSENYDAWNLLGDFYRFDKKLGEAEQAYTKAIELKKFSVESLNSRASARLGLNKVKDAETDVDAVLKMSKKNFIATQMKGMISYRQGDFTEAKANFDKVLQSEPAYLPAVLWSAFTAIALKNFEEANSHLGRYVGAVPGADNVKAVQAFVQANLGDQSQAKKTLAGLKGTKFDDPETLALIGQTHLTLGDSDRAVEYFREQQRLTPGSTQSHLNIASAQLQKGDEDQAIGELRKALELDAANNDAQALLVKALLAEKRFDEALKEVRQMKVARPTDPLAYTLEGVVLLMQKNESQAISAFKDALKVQQGFPLAVHHLAIISLRKGDKAAARSLYLDANHQHPDHAATLVALYSLDKAGGRNSEAVQWLENAAGKHVENPMVSALLSREYSSQGQHLKALSATEQAAKKHPNDVGLLEARGIAELGAGQVGDALRDFRRWVDVQPDSADANFYLAQTLAATNNVPAAKQSLDKAIKLDARHLGAMVFLAKLHLRQNDPAKARPLAADLRRKFPAVPEGWLIEADALMLQKQFAAAAQVVRELLAKGDQHVTTENTLRLARALWAAGNRKESLDEASAWTKKHPQDVATWIFIAESKTVLGQTKEAVEIYERLLTIAPEQSSVLNNLAWLLKDDSPVRALSLAEKAYKLAPKQAAIADTYAVVLLANKQSGRAVTVLAEFAKRGSHADIQYHYALALTRSGEKTEATDVLKRILRESGAFSEKKAAQHLMDELSPG